MAAAAQIGVLALQGGYEAHRKTLEKLGFSVCDVRTPESLQAVAGLVLPGGESTVHLRLLDRFGMNEALRAFLVGGQKPVLATCAGLILAAAHVHNPEQRSFAAVDADVSRNAWGRQLDSFEASSDRGRPLVFIRAPKITRCGSKVEVLDTFQGEPILIRQGLIVGASFHPELTDDMSIHQETFASLRP